MKRIYPVLTVFILVLFLNAFPVYGAPAAEPAKVKAEAAILTDWKTGKILYEKNIHQKVYPASITKILTALLVLEDLDMKESVTVGKEINLVEKDASEAGLVLGEKITGSDLIWAMMLPSGNDAAYTAAVTVARKKSGNASMEIKDAVTYFSDLMNKKAQEIGAKESHFANPDGYPNEDHYSSAYDLALIAKEAMKNDFFREVVGTYTYTIQDAQFLKGSKAPAPWLNRNLLLNPKSKYYYSYATGIKTGHTSLAGYCLAASAEKDGMTLIAVVLKADKEETRCVDAKNLFEYGFGQFKYHTLFKKGDKVAAVKVSRKYFGKETDLDVQADKDFTDILTDADFAALQKNTSWDKKLVLHEDGAGAVKLLGPIKSGQVLGQVSYTLNGKVMAESNLVAAQDTSKGGLSDTVESVLDQAIRYKYYVLAGIVLVVGALVILIRRGSKKKGKSQ